PSIINLAHNEVNIQYRYGSKFRVKSVLIITWEGGRPEDSDSEGNLFQLALVIGDTMTFAHFVYSKLNSNDNAVAGFSSINSSYSLPDSATHDAMLLSEKSDIGIPGEWLFRVDEAQVYLCGAGFKGLECIDSCASSQWFNDCSRSCHCDGGDPCDQETGRCPNGRCSPGWKGAPICDE
ncbi:Nidogen-like protein, partial [Teladorsagia circumcincta]